MTFLDFIGDVAKYRLALIATAIPGPPLADRQKLRHTGYKLDQSTVGAQGLVEELVAQLNRDRIEVITIAADLRKHEWLESAMYLETIGQNLAKAIDTLGYTVPAEDDDVDPDCDPPGGDRLASIGEWVKPYLFAERRAA